LPWSASRNGLGRGTAWTLLALLAILSGSVVAIFILSGDRGPALAGLPAAAVAEIAGLWLLPLPLVTLAYALTFRREGLSAQDLERLRKRFAGRPGDEQGAADAGREGRR
jgi:hypothetical protein